MGGGGIPAVVVFGARPNVTVVLSGRPILFIESDAALRDGATRLYLLDFRDEHIARWCEPYRASAGLRDELSLEFLAERDLVAVARTPIVLYMTAVPASPDWSCAWDEQVIAADAGMLGASPAEMDAKPFRIKSPSAAACMP